MNSDINDLEAPPAPPPTPPNRTITTTVTPTVSNFIYIPPAMMTRSTSSTSSVATTAAYHNNNCNKMSTALLSSSTHSPSLDAGSAVTITNDFKLNNELNSSAKLFNERKPQERYVWEMRTRSPNVTPASTVLNSPDLSTDVQYAMHQHSRQHSHQHHPHHQIRLGRSPVSQFEQHNMLPQGLASPGSPTDVGKASGQCLRDGEIVVFDDIDTNWMNKTNNAPKESLHSVTAVAVGHNEDILKVTKMIGQLPIAEYEGSPRRFGNNLQQFQQQTPSLQANQSQKPFPKRPPGFPQRVSPQSAAQQEARQQQQQQFYAAVALANDSVAIDNKSVGNLIDIDDISGCNMQTSAIDSNVKTKTPTFDYLYEFSETRKVLEEFFKGANAEDEKRFSEFNESDDMGSCDTRCEPEENTMVEQAYVGQRLARLPKEELYMAHRSPRKQPCDNAYNEHNDIELYIDSNSRSSGDLADTELEANLRRHSRNFTLSPETTDYDSNCGDLDSLSNDINCQTDFGKLYTSMPVLEDGLSSGHASDTENNITSDVCEKKAETNTNDKIVLQQQQQQQQQKHQQQQNQQQHQPHQQHQQQQQHQQLKQLQMFEQNEYNAIITNECHENCHGKINELTDGSLISDLVDAAQNDDLKQEQSHQQTQLIKQQQKVNYNELLTSDNNCCNTIKTMALANANESNSESNYETVYTAVKNTKQSPPPPPAPASYRRTRPKHENPDIQEAMNDIRSALQRAKTQPEKLKFCDEVLPADPDSPIWVPRKMAGGGAACENNHKTHCIGDEDEADTDLETDRLLGQQRLDDQGYFEEKTIWPKTSRISDSNEHSPTTSDVTMLTNSTTNNNNSNNNNNKPQTFSSATIRQGIGTSLTPTTPDHCQIIGTADVTITSPEKLQYSKSPTGSIKSLKDSTNSDKKAKSRNKEGLLEPAVLIEGVLFRARYLGSTQLVCEGQPTKSTRMMQAEEAVSRIKAPEGESQPSTEVDLFISTEKIMVLNTDLKEIMMDHALRTISYIADIGDLVVLMARRRFVPSDSSLSDADNAGNNASNISSSANATNGGSIGGSNKPNRTPKMICHVFESDEAQFIAQSIGQAFQVAYMEFLKANGIEDHSFVKEMDYQEVLNSQEIFGDELEIFAKKELQKEVVVPKAKGEILGVVIVESGWGSMLPTVVIANLMSAGAAARCGQLNIGDQLIAINGMSLVGLPLSTCQSYIRNAKNQTAVKFTVVPCPPVVEVKIKRPNTKYQLGFSVQNGVICSLLRGGIAERGGVRVGHRIIEINNQSVVAVPHEKIVNLLATSVGEILMKTMPTSMFRLLTGQENPIYI